MLSERDLASRFRLRWLVVTTFMLASALNYLDRQLLAAVAPLIKSEFQLSNHDYGLILLAFSLAYASSSPLVGWMIDRVGLTRGIGAAVGAWSAIGAATGLVRTFPALLGVRAMLGLAETAIMPGAGKVNGTYLPPREFALGAAMNQIGLSLGGIAAPLVVGWLAQPYGWRSVFLLCGAVGFVWVPIWVFVSRAVPARAEIRTTIEGSIWAPMRETRFIGLIAGNILSACMYTLWTNWVTLYFVETWKLTQAEANQRYAWIPPMVATLGGLFGGALAYMLIRSGVRVEAARVRVCWISAAGMLLTAFIPLMPTPAWATFGICFSYFWSTCLAVTVYVMPVDLFGPGRAAFGVSLLTFSYGLLQAVLSPAIGATIDRFGFPAVLIGFSILPAAGVAVIQATGFARAPSPLVATPVRTPAPSR